MTRKEWKEEIDQLVAACHSFQHAFSLEEDDDRTEELSEVWDYTEDIVRACENLRLRKR